MVGLSDSTNSTGVQQQHSNSFPLVIERKRYCCNPCSKMIKISSLGLLVILVIVVITVAVYADPQAEGTTKRTRAKQSVLRKKKPVVSKVTTTLFPNLEDEVVVLTSSLPEVSLTSPSFQENSILDNITEEATSSLPTTTSTKTKKISFRGKLTPRLDPYGCGECDLDECTTPQDGSCSTGLVMDRCSCCRICAIGEGHRCYNSTLNLPYNPDVGICGQGMSCLLRTDLESNEPREALCECRDPRIVCGSDQKTYLSDCRLREAAYSKPDLVVSSWNPCVSAPSITTPVENVTTPIGEDVSMSCEVRGYPAPLLHWEFQAEGSNAEPMTLPGDDSGIVIVVRGGPEQMMTTSWIQMIAVNPSRQGTYSCIAKNSVGTSRSLSSVQIYKSPDDDEDQ